MYVVCACVKIRTYEVCVWNVCLGGRESALVAIADAEYKVEQR